MSKDLLKLPSEEELKVSLELTCDATLFQLPAYDTSDPINQTTVNKTNENHQETVGLCDVAMLLDHFDGNIETFKTWVERVRYLNAEYNLDDSSTKILICMRLEGRASEWLHSKPEYIQMTSDELLNFLWDKILAELF